MCDESYLIIYPNGDKVWHKLGTRPLEAVYHRTDGPAHKHIDGYKAWIINGLYHREDGPAIEYSSGSKYWYNHGKLHREGGPAIIDKITKRWYKNGKLHREDGPAVQYLDQGIWYINGTQIKCDSQKEFERIIKLKSFI